MLSPKEFSKQISLLKRDKEVIKLLTLGYTNKEKFIETLQIVEKYGKITSNPSLCF